MCTIRKFEETVFDLYTRALIPGIAHISIGQEAVPVGVCSALATDDYITSTHRGHGHCLAKGADPFRMFAELFGRESGYCGGKGGSMHIADPATGNLGANAIVGGSIGIATGAALSAKLRSKGQVVVCFFGDGAANQGILLETMNMASIWKLPCIYVCENNQFGEYTRGQDVTAGHLAERGTALGIVSHAVDGMDVVAVREYALEAVRQGREGRGPTLLVCDTYRFLGHGMSDRDRRYRSREEEDQWRKRDPILSLATVLRRDWDCGEDLAAIEEAITAEIATAADEAGKEAYPPLETVTSHVYADR